MEDAGKVARKESVQDTSIVGDAVESFSLVLRLDPALHDLCSSVRIRA